MNEEIVMEEALYGRMRTGRCVVDDYLIGCSMNVLYPMDSLCSGKQICSVSVIDPLLFSAKLKANVCPKALVYLRASYQCLKGM